MSNIKHPEPEKLIEYVESAQGETDRRVALHLACCNECRVHVSNLMRLQQQVQSLSQSTTATNGKVLDVEEEKAIVENKLSQEQLQRIKSDKQRLKAALFLASQVNASSSLKPQTAKPSASKNDPAANLNNATPSLWNTWALKLRQSFSQWEYAALAASLTIAVIFGVNLVQMTGQTNIVAYSDNPVVVYKQIKPNNPGMGFFSGAVNVSKAYSGVTIHASAKNQLSLNWPKVEGAENYLLQLYHINKGGNELVFEKRTLNTALLVNNISLQAHTRYEWKLSGNTTDQRRFSASGGFVLQ